MFRITRRTHIEPEGRPVPSIRRPISDWLNSLSRSGQILKQAFDVAHTDYVCVSTTGFSYAN